MTIRLILESSERQKGLPLRRRQARLIARVLIVLSSTLVAALPLPSLAQPKLDNLKTQLQHAVAAQNWQRAIQIVNQMISEAPQRAPELKTYRTELQKLFNAGVKVPRTAPNQSIRIPIKRRESGIAFIEVTFNRKQRFDMAIDSGSSLTVITQAMAAALGLTRADIVDQVAFLTANGKTVMPIVYLDTVEVGSLVTSRLPVAIASANMTVGLLGQDFLRKYEVSFKADVIEFHHLTR
ncbi:MAG TPA: retropepsin-like aspartic protease [Candidatus Caenarcaniphilales bacterium]